MTPTWRAVRRCRRATGCGMVLHRARPDQPWRYRNTPRHSSCPVLEGGRPPSPVHRHPRCFAQCKTMEFLGASVSRDLSDGVGDRSTGGFQGHEGEYGHRRPVQRPRRDQAVGERLVPAPDHPSDAADRRGSAVNLRPFAGCRCRSRCAPARSGQRYAPEWTVGSFGGSRFETVPAGLKPVRQWDQPWSALRSGRVPASRPCRAVRIRDGLDGFAPCKTLKHGGE